MSDRAPTVVTLTMGPRAVGVLAPLPDPLGRADLLRALDDGPDAGDVSSWLEGRLRSVTGSPYVVTPELSTWEHDADGNLTYEAVRITLAAG